MTLDAGACWVASEGMKRSLKPAMKLKMATRGPLSPAAPPSRSAWRAANAMSAAAPPAIGLKAFASWAQRSSG